MRTCRNEDGLNSLSVKKKHKDDVVIFLHKFFFSGSHRCCFVCLVCFVFLGGSAQSHGIDPTTLRTLFVELPLMHPLTRRVATAHPVLLVGFV